MIQVKAFPYDIVLGDYVLLRMANIHEFVTPDFEELIKQYPAYVEAQKAAGVVPLSRVAYLHAICKQLETQDARPGRTRAQWFIRIFQHFDPRDINQWFMNGA